MQTPFIMSRQFAEEVSTRWWRRDSAYLDNECTFVELAHFDEQIDALLDGLQAHGEHGKKAALEQLQKAGLSDDVAADGFCAFALALLRQDPEYFNEVLTQLRGSPFLSMALGSAMQWIDGTFTSKVALWCVQHPEPALIVAGLQGLTANEYIDPEHLQKLVHHSDDGVSIATLTFCGNMQKTQLTQTCRDLLQSPTNSHSKQFALLRTTLLLAPEHVLPSALWTIACSDSVHANEALQLLGAYLPVNAAVPQHLPIATKDADQTFLRLAALWGSTTALRRCVELLSTPFNMQACYAIQAVTGFEFDSRDDGAEQTKIFNAWWSKNQQRFNDKQRYLFGHLVTCDVLRSALLELPQSQRENAALLLRKMRYTPSVLPMRAAARQQLRLIQTLSIHQEPA